MDVKAIEGAELNYCWADELVEPAWIEALRFRLITRNGELAVGFTPILGYTDTVAEYLAGAITLEDAPAELLTDLKGQPLRVPRVQQCSKPTARVVYFHTADNPFGNYEAMKTELLKSSKDRVLMRPTACRPRRRPTCSPSSTPRSTSSRPTACPRPA